MRSPKFDSRPRATKVQLLALPTSYARRCSFQSRRRTCIECIGFIECFSVASSLAALHVFLSNVLLTKRDEAIEEAAAAASQIDRPICLSLSLFFLHCQSLDQLLPRSTFSNIVRAASDVAFGDVAAWARRPGTAKAKLDDGGRRRSSIGGS